MVAGHRGPAGAWLPRGPGGQPGLTSCSPSPGPSLSCFHWPRGVQACARLQQLLDWTRGAGFGEAGEHFFRKLSCTLNLLATPRAQLIQVGERGERERQGVSGGGGACVITESPACGPGFWASENLQSCFHPTAAPTCEQENGPKMSVVGSAEGTDLQLTM